MHRTVAAVLTALVGLGPLALATAPAHAESSTVRDAVDDVVDGRFRPSDEPGYDRDEADIRRTELDHRREQVVMRLTMGEVRVGGRRTLEVVGRLAAPGGDRWSVVLERQGRSSEELTLVREGSGAAIDCAGLDAALRPDAALIRLTVPRSCLGDPASLRYGAGVTISWPAGVNSRDDARRNGGIDPSRPWVIKLGADEVRSGPTG